MSGNRLILPDSRLTQRPDLATQMVDWELPSGQTVRVEVCPVYCANCGKLYGQVPRDNCVFTFWLCRKCFESYGAIVGTYAQPEEEFNQAVAYEIEQRFGHALSTEDLAAQADEGRLGATLENLLRDSPYPVYEGPLT